MTTLQQAANVTLDLAPLLEDLTGVTVHVHAGVVTVELSDVDREDVAQLAALWDRLGQPTPRPSGMWVSSRDGVAVVVFSPDRHDVRVLA